MKLAIFSFVFLAISCSPTFKLRKADTTGINFSEECKGLVTLIDTTWYKHKHRNCHLYNKVFIEFKDRYKSCLIGLTKTEIKQLFGEPDEFDKVKYKYIFHQNCPKFFTSFHSLTFAFVNDKVYHVLYGQGMIIID